MKSEPIIISEKIHKPSDLEKLRKSKKLWKESDFYNEQLEELFLIINPSAKLTDYKSKLEQFIKERNISNSLTGSWVYYPWNGHLIHILGPEDFVKVRTNRNKNIITEDEQNRLYDFNVGILGLSIGNSMALSLVYSGIAKNMKIADFDNLELSNLNRIRSSLTDLGVDKNEITARQIFEINPYQNLEVFGGIKQDNLSEFVSGNNKPKLIFDAIDDFEIKIKVRLEAKKAKIPVVMLTNLGDRLLVDVERYDLDDSTQAFNGLIGSTAEEILSKPISEQDKQKYAVAIVGKDNIPKRVLESVMEVNKTLVGRPQVMSTVTIGGGVASYITRRIAVGELSSGRYLIDFDSLIK